MELLIQARLLADYMLGMDSFLNFSYGQNRPLGYSHIGALYTNVVLQAGLNYKHVVQPRVHKVRAYNEAETVSGFVNLIKKNGLENIINWNGGNKIERLNALLLYSQAKKINTCNDLRIFLQLELNRIEFLELKGFGPKTLDYMLKLLDFDTVAVDRHVYAFVESAGLQRRDYYHTKNVVEFAADLLNISRSTLDYSIWKYMSEKRNPEPSGFKEGLV